MNINNSEIYQIILMFSIFTLCLLGKKYREKEFDKLSLYNKIKYPLLASLIGGLVFSQVYKNKNIFKASGKNVSTIKTNMNFYTEYPNF